MQKILNDFGNMVEEMLEGFVKAYPERVKRTNHPRVLQYKKSPAAGKVAVVTGGGAGHKPAFIGYIGKNFCDAVAVGNIFTSPPAQAFLEAFRASDGGNGVACLYGNFSGDNMNVKIAVDLAREEGIEVKTVVANDDVASAPKGQEMKRRGSTGEILMWKIAGAQAAMGASLDEVIATAQRAISNIRSIGVGLSPCTIPEVGHPNFTIEKGKMELGIGHHGEPGIKVVPMQNATEIAEMMLATIISDFPLKKGDRVTVLLSGLGATPVMELYILFNQVDQLLNKMGIEAYRSYVGNYFTSLDMGGATLTLMKLDEELTRCIDYYCESTALTQYLEK